LGYKKWFLNLSAKVGKKNVKKERICGYYGKNSVIYKPNPLAELI